jgi:hypothetical protein
MLTWCDQPLNSSLGQLQQLVQQCLSAVRQAAQQGTIQFHYGMGRQPQARQ